MITKKTIGIIYAISSLIFGISCKEAKKEAKELTQMERVMATHDEVMPKMGTMGKLSNQLEGKIKEVSDSTAYLKAQKDLKDANTAMMQWMQGFGDRFDGDEILDGKELTPQKQEWLNEEEQKVNALKEQINMSIKNAEQLLGKE